MDRNLVPPGSNRSSRPVKPAENEAPARAPWPARRLMASKVLLALGGLIVGLAFVEAALRSLYPIGGQPAIFQPDPVLGHVNQPNVSITHLWDNRENRSRITTDGLGLRGPAHPADKPPGTFRVLMLGDSYTFGYGVGDEVTFAALLERALGRDHRVGTRVEVINGGVSAYGTAQELLLFDRLAPRIAPDLVVLNLFIGNDIQDNLCLSLGSLHAHHRAPCFDVRAGELVQVSEPEPPCRDCVSTEPPMARLRSWLRNLRVYQLASQRGVALVTTTPLIVSFLSRVGIRLDPGYMPHVVEGWFGAQSTHGWEITRELIMRLRRRASDRGAAFALIMIPSRVQVLPELQAVSRLLYSGDVEVQEFFRDPDRPQRQLAELAASEGIPALDLTPALVAEANPGRLYYPVIAHWNEAGHRLAATEIARFLVAEGLVP